jgi:oligoribonuclease
MTDADHLIWVDLEMTGLNPDTHHIVEIASVVTSSELDIIAEGPDLVIHQPEERLEQMGSWCTKHHKESGLLDDIRESNIGLEEAERQTLDFLQKHVKAETAPLCGNSIGQDRRFLYNYMPALSDFLHYRNIDVSSIKELVSRWYPEQCQAPEKANNHRAHADILESIEELRWYAETVFVDR